MKQTLSLMHSIFEGSKKLLIQSAQVGQKTETLFHKFVDAFYAHTSPEQLIVLSHDHDPQLTSQLVAHAWQYFYSQTKDYNIVNYNNQNANDNRHTFQFMTIIHKECPFLVDTIILLLQEMNLEYIFEVHPLLNVMRDDEGELIDIADQAQQNRLPGFQKEFVISVIFPDEMSTTTLEKFEERLHFRLSKVQKVVADFDQYQQQISLLANYYLDKTDDPQCVEIGTFLSWVNTDNFVYLGSRLVPLANHKQSQETTQAYGLFAFEDFANNDNLIPQMGQIPFLATFDALMHNDFGEHPPYLHIRRTCTPAIIHRKARYISLEILEPNGKAVRQFIGLFTRQFYLTPQRQIPFLAEKLKTFKGLFSFDPKSQEEKFFEALLELVVNDEIFYVNPSDFSRLLNRVMYRPNQAALHLIHEDNTPYTDVMLFVPNSNLSPEIKANIFSHLEKVLEGKIIDDATFSSTCPISYIHLVINHEQKVILHCDIEEVEFAINTLCHSWQENFERQWKSLLKSNQKKESVRHIGFEKHYQDSFSITQGVSDANQALLAIHNPKQKIIQVINGEKDTFILQVFTKGERISLSRLMPIFESLGIDVARESESKIKLNQDVCYLQNFDCAAPSYNEKTHPHLIEAFHALFMGEIENDILNHLVIAAGLCVREVIVMRALIRAMWQMGYPTSGDYIQKIVVRYPTLAKTLMRFFDQSFNPKADTSSCQQSMSALEEDILQQLLNIAPNDHDRVLRHLFKLIKAIVRTNVYQLKDYVSFKFLPSKVPLLPRPWPEYEIFIYAEYMEGVHLRAGKVARGGIRWSDRLDDFRQEVLGLLKAQMVKNSIIVPLGSKGGFISRHYDALAQKGTHHKALKAEVVRCYQTFIKGLLDVTDNLVDGKLVHPQQVICYDENDPYLVVAADKGTASFSDIANEISKTYNFWLGDAFASGGSAGYDHKKMAITSRGAWISVIEHLAALGLDPEHDDFTVAGVGDMSGDVFGNGMLRSRHIKLVAAFDRNYIFIDPNPDPETSYNERKRLFDLPESTWMDYQASLLSKGGIIVKREMKEITLSVEARKALGIDDIVPATITAEDIVQCILKAPVDVLWFGGIGTYIKESHESNRDVMDAINNSVRIDAIHLRAKIIGEGANLALTQRARIEFDQLGGLINTDAIDNSAGVSCSDHEVNIKILSRQLIIENKINIEERNALLIEMADEVADLILADNVKQNKVLTMLKADSILQLERYHQLILFLSKDPYQPLDPSLEFLPSDEELLNRAKIQKGLARPELAVILAYSKIVMFKHLVSTCQDMDDSTCQTLLSEFDDELLNYFPTVLQTKYKTSILKHPLAKEIVATVLSNEYINDVGPVYAFIGIALNDSDYWSSILIYKQMVYLLNSILHEFSAHEKIMLMTQMQLAHKRVNVHHICVTTLEQWLSFMPRYASISCLELSDRLAAAHLTEQERQSFQEQFQVVAQALHFADFSHLCKMVSCREVYQMQALANVLDDFSKAIVDISMRMIMAKETANVEVLISDKRFQQLSSTLATLIANGQGSIEFALHYVKNLPEFVDKTLTA